MTDAKTAIVSPTPSYLFEPNDRDAHYGTNVAQYLVDLHDYKATFNFCGGMMFQLVLSDQLREYLGQIASQEQDVEASNPNNHQQQQQQQPKIFDANSMRMFRIPNYSQSAEADNIQIFHGREIRNVPHAKGGMNLVLHLSLANNNKNNNNNDNKNINNNNGNAINKQEDPEGWSVEEMAEYNGWMHDTSRKWRTLVDWEKQGFVTASKKFGLKSFGLHHRFYLHLDKHNQIWLSAEDGCEGTPQSL